MSQHKEKEKNYNNNKKQKKPLKLFDCFKNCLKSSKKPKEESISEAELIIKKHKDLLKFNINTINKINNTTCTKPKTNPNSLKTPLKISQKKKQHNKFLPTQQQICRLRLFKNQQHKHLPINKIPPPFQRQIRLFILWRKIM